jgi:ElaB/YqjD/DUF883 family membrane-anchored ribosome-binding protein
MEKSLSNKDDISLSELKSRKKILEDELESIKVSVSSTTSDIKDDIVSSILPIERIRKQPFKSIGIAIAAGFILGLPRLRGKRIKGESVKSYGFSSMLIDELKRMAARKAMIYITDLIDDEVMPRIRKKKEK